MRKVTLHISRVADQPGYYLVVVNGEGFIHSANRAVGATIRGADTWFDDRLFEITRTGVRVDNTGSFSLSHVVYKSELNEDWGKDEIYASVRVEGLSGSYETNTVSGYF